jgi:hypothetical protein
VEDQPRWHHVTSDIWTLVDSSGTILRHVAKLGPYIGQPAPRFRVTGPGYEATDHPSLDEATGAAEASLSADSS